MKKATILLILTIIFLVQAGSSALSQDVDLSKFKYQRQITVNCNEFIGYSSFDVPSDILSKSQNLQNFYIDSEYFFKGGSDSQINDWYVKNSNTPDIESINSVLDSYDSTYYSISKPNNLLEIELKNPNIVTFDKVVISLTESELDDIQFIDDHSNKLSPYIMKDKFQYSFFFGKKLTTDAITIRIYFSNILKVSEIKIYNHEKDKVYFFVNNNCKNNFNLYYGGYGGNSQSYARHDTSKVIQATLQEESINPKYNSDFDSDGIVNENDNCINIKNPDQKDINYNGVGDACEDFDSDGIINSKDNCIDKPNYDQSDSDNDGMGDACDSSDDRFSEKNQWAIYLVVVIVLLIFAFFAYIIFSKNKQK